MPKQYEALRNKFEKEGMSEKEAEGHAARIYNAGRKPGQKPVTGNEEKSKSRMTVLETLKKGPSLS